MKIKPVSYFLIIIILIAVVAVSYGVTLPTMKAKLVPIITAGLTIILAGIELIRELRAGYKAKSAAEAEAGKYAGGTKSELFGYIKGWGWMALLAVGIYLFGFLIAIPIFVFTYLKLNKRGWLMSICITVVMELFIYGVFARLLQVDLYPGLIFGGTLW